MLREPTSSQERPTVGVPNGSPRRVACYDDIAEWYSVHVRNSGFHKLVIPPLLTLAQVKPGASVCDVACGEGVVTKWLGRLGATPVGVDLSGRLLTMARAEGRGAFVHADACGGLPFPGDTFDIVTSSMALTDLEDLDGALREIARVLRPAGGFVFSVAHPCFKRPFTSPEDDPDQCVVSDDYLTERYWVAPTLGVRGRVGSIHRSLSRYLSALGSAGLAVTDSIEVGDESVGPALPVAWIARAVKGVA